MSGRIVKNAARDSLRAAQASSSSSGEADAARADSQNGRASAPLPTKQENTPSTAAGQGGEEEAELTPRQIVAELDKHIIGQAEAKRAVALALRNRWRRLQVEEPLRNEITPKNILLIGPTGVGKTEISRRLARLANAPFIKVEATKFTEVGYVGRDVDAIIRDLVDNAYDDVKERFGEEVREQAEQAAEERLLDALLPGGRDERDDARNAVREKFRRMLREGKLDEREVEIEVRPPAPPVDVMSPPGMEEMRAQFQTMMQQMSGARREKRRMAVVDALHLCAEEETELLLDPHKIKDTAMDWVEENGIVFIDEIDKIAASGGGDYNADASRLGVQRDLLPLIEGAAVPTRYGTVHTDHILFIASGAFQQTRPDDLMPELQGRFPLRVTLKPLTIDDFRLILTGTDFCLTRQYEALLGAEGVKLRFDKKGVAAIAEIAWNVNEKHENIGARRLYTVMERLLDEVSFDADKMSGGRVDVDEEYVRRHLSDIADDIDKARYIL